MLRCLVALLAVTLVASTVVAQELEPQSKELKTATISIGDPAPKLEVEKWVKGDPIREFQKGHVYVVDFWATWCGPCKKAIPHMTEIQKKYDGKVTVVGMSIWENAADDVAPFVKEKGDDMAYTVATDMVPAGDGAYRKRAAMGKMAQSWMKPAGRNGIPSVFIVNGEGQIAWIGHPMGGMDEALEGIVSGDYDIEVARKEYDEKQAEAKKRAEERAAINRGFREHMSKNDFAGAVEFAGTVESESMRANLLNIVAWTIVDPKGSVKDKNLKVAMEAAVEADKLTEHQNAAIIDTLARVHFLKGHTDRAIELQEKAVQLAPETLSADLKAALEEYRSAKKADY